MKNILIVLGLSFLFTVIIGALIALGLYFILGSFWGPFFITIGSIMFIGYFSNRLIEAKFLHNIADIQLEREKINSEQSVEVVCSYCKQINISNVKLGQRNVFKCKKCNQENLIVFQFATTQITKPIILPDLGAIQIPETPKASEVVPV